MGKHKLTDELNTIGNFVTGLDCTVIGLSLVYLAWKYDGKKLSRIFLVFAFLFLAGGVPCFERMGDEGVSPVLAGMMVVVAVAATIAAFVTVKCVSTIYVALTRLAVWERGLTNRVRELNARESIYLSDREFVTTLAELRDTMRGLLGGQ